MHNHVGVHITRVIQLIDRSIDLLGRVVVCARKEEKREDAETRRLRGLLLQRINNKREKE